MQHLFENPTITRFKSEFSGVKYLIVDEAQRLPNIGLRAFEFKWNTLLKARITQTFTKAYPQAQTQIITPENYIEFIYPN